MSTVFWVYVLPMIISFIGGIIYKRNSDGLFWGDVMWVALVPAFNWISTLVVLYKFLGENDERNVQKY